MSLTGYELDAPPVTAADSRLEPLVEACAETGAVALVGAPVRKDTGHRYISTLAVDGAGATVAYHKMWLGAAEGPWFAAGTTPAVLDVDGWRLGLAICKDTGTPGHVSATAALGIDVYVAGIVESADDAALQEERACRIATEHGVWVAVASFAGSTGGGSTRTAGGSSIWSAEGVPVVQAGRIPGEIVQATLRRSPRRHSPPGPAVIGPFLRVVDGSLAGPAVRDPLCSSHRSGGTGTTTGVPGTCDYRRAGRRCP